MTWDHRKRWSKRKTLAFILVSCTAAYWLGTYALTRVWPFVPSKGEGAHDENSNSAWGKYRGN